MYVCRWYVSINLRVSQKSQRIPYTCKLYYINTYYIYIANSIVMYPNFNQTKRKPTFPRWVVNFPIQNCTQVRKSIALTR